VHSPDKGERMNRDELPNTAFIDPTGANVAAVRLD
jgi:hypothetical protein